MVGNLLNEKRKETRRKEKESLKKSDEEQLIYWRLKRFNQNLNCFFNESLFLIVSLFNLNVKFNLRLYLRFNLIG